MKLHRFYVGALDAAASVLVVSDAELLHQWARVLRFAPGDEIALFDSARREGLYRIDTLSKTEAQLSRVAERTARGPERAVTLAFALLKKDKNEWVLQKGTELGVSRFVPLLTERTEKTGWSAARARKIVTEAAEQCGRADVPEVCAPVKLGDFLAAGHGRSFFYCDEGGALISEQVHDPDAPVVFVGPEGGWTDEERVLFERSGAARVSLGKFTLRAETAAVAAVALVLRL